MELVLNLIWLFLGATAFAFVLGGETERHVTLRRLAVVTMVLVCLLALLFPIISMSDDFADRVALEESSIRKANPDKHLVPVAEPTEQIVLAISLTATGCVETLAAPIQRTYFDCLSDPRSPPRLSHLL